MDSNRNAALDCYGQVWAQGEYTDLWRCLTLRLEPLRYNDLVARYGPVDTVRPVIEKYQPVR